MHKTVVADTIPKELIKAFKEGRASFFVGAGLSKGVGLPDWPELLEELLIRVKNSIPRSNEYVNQCKKLLKNPANYLTLAQELREKLGSDEFNKYIRERFVDRRPEPNDVFKTLVEIPYNFIITTNYDYLIEDAYAFVYRRNAKVYTYQKPQAMADNVWNKYPFILKAHGEADEPDKIILSDKDYRNLIHNSIGYKSILQVLFTTDTILFLGTSLTDPELILLLGFLRNAYHEGGPKHFALMDQSTVEDIIAERWRKDYGINIITYDSYNNHIQVLQFLQQLKKKVS